MTAYSEMPLEQILQENVTGFVPSASVL